MQMMTPEPMWTMSSSRAVGPMLNSELLHTGDIRMKLRWNETEECQMNVVDLVWYMLPVVAIVPVLAIPTNGVVIRVLLTKPRLCSTSEIFTLNMAVLDLLFCLCVTVEFYLLFCDPIFDRSHFFSWGFNQAGGPILLSLMSLDSFLGVCHPLLFLKLKNPNIRLLLCSAVNLFTGICGWLLKSNAMFKWQGLSTILVVNFWIISCCNVAILRTLKRSGPGRSKVHPVKKRAVRIVLCAFLLIGIHYLMPMLEFIIRTFSSAECAHYTAFTSVAYTTLSFSSISQPLTFLVRTNQLHKLLTPWRVNTKR